MMKKQYLFSDDPVKMPTFINFDNFGNQYRELDSIITGVLAQPYQ